MKCAFYGEKIKLIYFADTNFFLECKAPQNLDWKSITSDAEIFLYICYPVIQEIDKHKHNPQKSRKTKKIQRLLTELLKNDRKKEYNLKNNQKLIVKIAKAYHKSDLETIENLEIEIKDDEIIATVVLFNKENSSEAVLLTHDYGMQLKAEPFLEVYFVPEDWLSTETDEVQKENEKLKAELLKLQNKEPQINCNIYVNNILLKKDLKEHLDISLYDEISEAQINDYMQRMESHCSKVKECDNIFGFTKQIQIAIGYSYVEPSQLQIDEYNEKYSDWLKHQKNVLDTFVQKHNQVLLICPIKIELENIGTVPAESFEIEISSNTGEFFKSDDLNAYKEKLIEHFKVAPEYPKGEFKPTALLTSLSLSHLNIKSIPNISPLTFPHNNSREKFAFYPSYNNGKLKIQCGEMRHHKDKYVLESCFAINEDKLKNNRIDFSYQIYAKNLATSKLHTRTIDIDFTRISALESIEKELRKIDCI